MTVESIGSFDTVVDCDFHLTEEVDDLVPYLEPPFDRMQRHGYSFSSHVYPSPGLFHAPSNLGTAKKDVVKGPSDVIAGLEKVGSDRPILSPTQNLLLGGVNHDQLAVALASAYNRYLLDVFLDENDEFFGELLVAPQRPVRAAEEIDDLCDERGIVAVMLPGSLTHPPLGHERYDPIYESAERNGLPIMLHNAAAGILGLPFQFDGLRRHLSVHLVAHPVIHMIHLASLVTQGVPERFPDLRWVVQEAGLGWFPYFMHRFDHDYNANRQDAPLLSNPPSDYLREQFYLTTQPIEGTASPAYVRQVVHHLNDGRNVMFSSDHPHVDFDHSNQLLRALGNDFDDETLEYIYGKTAMEIFPF